MPLPGKTVDSRRPLIRRWAFLVWLAAGPFVPAAHAQTPASTQWIDVHLHLIGGRGQDYAGAADTAIREMDRFGIWKELLSRHAGRFTIGTDSFMVSASVRDGGPGVTFAQKNTPTLQATVHFLSLLPPDTAARLGRENAMRIYKLPPK